MIKFDDICLCILLNKTNFSRTLLYLYFNVFDVYDRPVKMLTFC